MRFRWSHLLALVVGTGCWFSACQLRPDATTLTRLDKENIFFSNQEVYPLPEAEQRSGMVLLVPQPLVGGEPVETEDLAHGVAEAAIAGIWVQDNWPITPQMAKLVPLEQRTIFPHAEVQPLIDSLLHGSEDSCAIILVSPSVYQRALTPAEERPRNRRPLHRECTLMLRQQEGQIVTMNFRY